MRQPEDGQPKYLTCQKFITNQQRKSATSCWIFTLSKFRKKTLEALPCFFSLVKVKNTIESFSG